MRIGKCTKCKGEMYIESSNWNGWRIFKCTKCDFSLDNAKLNSKNFKECLKELYDLKKEKTQYNKQVEEIMDSNELTTQYFIFYPLSIETKKTTKNNYLMRIMDFNNNCGLFRIVNNKKIIDF